MIVARVHRLSQGQVFFLALAVGTIGIVIGRLAGVRLMQMLLPVAAMVVYYFLGRRITHLRGSWEHFGDSLYYLGFLFTLIALVSSLAFLSPDNKIEFNGLVQGFGVALVTTIVGLCFRLTLPMMSVTPEESSEAASKALAAATDRFRQEVDRLAREVISENNSIRGVLGTSLKETQDSLKNLVNFCTNEIEAAIQAAGKHVDESAKVAVENFERTATELEQRVSQVDQEIGEAAAKFVKRTGDQTEAAIKMVSEHADLSVNISVKSLEETVAETRKAVEMSSDLLGQTATKMQQRVTEADQEIGRVTSDFVKKTSNETDRFTQAISRLSIPEGTLEEALRGPLIELRECTKTSTNAIRSLLLTGHEFQNRITDLSAQIPELTTLLHDLSATTNEIVPKARVTVSEVTGQIRSDVSAAAGELTSACDRLRQTTGLMEDAHSTARAYLDQAKKDVDAAAEYRQEIVEDAAAAKDALLTVHRQLIETVGEIKTELSGD